MVLSDRFPIDDDLGLLEIFPIFFIHQYQIDRILDRKPIMDVFVGWG